MTDNLIDAHEDELWRTANGAAFKHLQPGQALMAGRIACLARRFERGEAAFDWREVSLHEQLALLLVFNRADLIERYAGRTILQAVERVGAQWMEVAQAVQRKRLNAAAALERELPAS